MKDFKIFDKVLCLIVHLVEEIQDLIEVILQELDGNRNKIGVILIQKKIIKVNVKKDYKVLVKEKA